MIHLHKRDVGVLASLTIFKAVCLTLLISEEDSLFTGPYISLSIVKLATEIVQ